MKDDILQKLDWSDVQEAVQQVNPALAKVINNINLKPHHKLIKATYSFGDLIIKQGRLCLPLENDKLRTQLNYSAIPLSLLLNKSAEAFIENGLPLPLNILKPGGFFGTFEAINFMMNKSASSIWNVSAGARSTFMLAKISNFSGLKRLRAHYDIGHSLKLNSLSDHWDLFRKITLKPQFTEKWQSEVLFFPRSWFTNIKDVAWFKFYQLIWGHSWSQAQYAMSDFNFRNDWQRCLKIIDARRLKPSPYIMDTIKHLLTIMMGFAPFFTPAKDTELDLPLIELQRAFTEIYLLEDYVPTLICPLNFNARLSSSMGYYSLAFPTLMSGVHPVKLINSFMPDLKLLKLMMDYLSEDNPESSPLYQVLLQYFHASKDKFQDVRSSHEIPLQDPAFLSDQRRFPDRIFCATSPFWRGCIRICAQALKSR